MVDLMIVATVPSMYVPIVNVLSKWQGIQPNRFLKRKLNDDF
jgi:hypothetical protein